MPGLIQDCIEWFQDYCVGHKRKFRKIRATQRKIVNKLERNTDKIAPSDPPSVLIYPSDEYINTPQVSQFNLFHQSHCLNKFLSLIKYKDLLFNEKTF